MLTNVVLMLLITVNEPTIVIILLDTFGEKCLEVVNRFGDNIVPY